MAQISPLWIAAVYAGMSLLTFVVYAVDKAAVVLNVAGLVVLSSPWGRHLGHI